MFPTVAAGLPGPGPSSRRRGGGGGGGTTFSEEEEEGAGLPPEVPAGKKGPTRALFPGGSHSGPALMLGGATQVTPGRRGGPAASSLSSFFLVSPPSRKASVAKRSGGRETRQRRRRRRRTRMTSRAPRSHADDTRSSRSFRGRPRGEGELPVGGRKGRRRGGNAALRRRRRRSRRRRRKSKGGPGPPPPPAWKEAPGTRRAPDSPASSAPEEWRGRAIPTRTWPASLVSGPRRFPGPAWRPGGPSLGKGRFPWGWRGGDFGLRGSSEQRGEKGSLL